MWKLLPLHSRTCVTGFFDSGPNLFLRASVCPPSPSTPQLRDHILNLWSFLILLFSLVSASKLTSFGSKWTKCQPPFLFALIKLSLLLHSNVYIYLAFKWKRQLCEYSFYFLKIKLEFIQSYFLNIGKRIT